MPKKANNIITFADLGFTVALVQQNSTSGVFESVQGNDVPADLVLTKGSVVYTISGTITWKMKSGSNLEVFGFIPSSSAAIYIISYSGGTYTLDSTSNYGLVEVEETLAALGIATGDDVSGSADSSTLTQLNAYLATVLANNPSGPVTVTTLSTSDSTPTLTGTVTLSGSETLTVSANGTLYTTSDSLVVDTVAGTWSLTLPTTTIGTYDVVATVTNTTGYTLSDTTLNELVVRAEGDVRTSVITASPTTIVANGVTTSTITVQLKDSGGTDLTASGGTVALSTTLGSLGAVTDKANGTYTATLTSGTTTGTATISGTLDSSAITDTATVAFTPGAASLTQSTITASIASILADGTTTSTITVQLKDANGNDLVASGGVVVLSSTIGTLGTVTDNGNGTYTATLTSATSTGTAMISGTLAGSAITDTEAVVFAPGAADVTQATIVASPTRIAADGAATSIITVQLKDANGNDLIASGGTVDLTTDLGTLGTVTDNANGTYTATLISDTTAGTATISGTLDSSALTVTATVTFTSATGADLTTSTITASPSSIEADGSTTSSITVQLKDSSGADLSASGGTVDLTTDLGTLGTVTDNGDGTYTATLTSSTTAGTATISGTLDSSAMTETATVTFTAGDADVTTSTITASPTSIVADGTTTSTVTVQLVDANGNDLTASGGTVDLTTDLGTPGTVTDNGDGTYTATLTSGTTTGTATISGTLDSVALTNTESVIFTEEDTTEPVITNPDGGTGTAETTVNANQTTVMQLTSDEPVTWTISGGPDKGKFQISASGKISFLVAPDYDNPSDSDGNNTYIFIVTATDASGNTTTHRVKVSVIYSADANLVDEVSDPLQPILEQELERVMGGLSVAVSGGDTYRKAMSMRRPQQARSLGLA